MSGGHALEGGRTRKGKELWGPQLGQACSQEGPHSMGEGEGRPRSWGVTSWS